MDDFFRINNVCINQTDGSNYPIHLLINWAQSSAAKDVSLQTPNSPSPGALSCCIHSILGECCAYNQQGEFGFNLCYPPQPFLI